MSDTLDLDRPLYGVHEIARELRRTPRQVYWCLERGHVPAVKMGRTWVTTPRRIRDWLNGSVTSGETA